jgi:hypothetical protein
MREYMMDAAGRDMQVRNFSEGDRVINERIGADNPGLFIQLGFSTTQMQTDWRASPLGEDHGRSRFYPVGLPCLSDFLIRVLHDLEGGVDVYFLLIAERTVRPPRHAR